jgi:hypothetical protein
MGNAQKRGVDTIEKAIYTLECKLNTPQKYSDTDRELMKQGIKWLKGQLAKGKTLADVIKFLPSDAELPE